MKPPSTGTEPAPPELAKRGRYGLEPCWPEPGRTAVASENESDGGLKSVAGFFA